MRSPTCKTQCFAFKSPLIVMEKAAVIVDHSKAAVASFLSIDHSMRSQRASSKRGVVSAKLKKSPSRDARKIIP